MDKYKINYIYNEKNDINEAFIRVLNKELKKYIEMICKIEKNEIPSSYNIVTLEDDKIG